MGSLFRMLGNAFGEIGRTIRQGMLNRAEKRRIKAANQKAQREEAQRQADHSRALGVKAAMSAQHRADMKGGRDD